MNEKLDSIELQDLYSAFCQLENQTECKNFLRDICTFSEMKIMAERLQVVKQLEEKKPYREIAKNTGASTATVTRVARWYHHGMGGYRLVMQRLGWLRP